MKTKLLGVVAALALIGVVRPNVANADPLTYTITDLGPGFANAINDTGTVVGYIFPAPTVTATIWNGTTPTSLGNLAGASTSTGSGINNAGQVVGLTLFNSAPNTPTATATIWNGTTPTALGTLGGNSFAVGINNAGQVVGYSYIGSNSVATVWNGTVPTALGSLPGTNNSRATAINDTGTVAGFSQGVATIWNGTVPTALGDLGHLPDQSPAGSVATGINNAGQVVGTLDRTSLNNNTVAVIWNGTIPTALGSLDGNVMNVPHGINDAGQVVGRSCSSNDCGTFTQSAVIWNGTTPTNLNYLLNVNDIDWIKAGWRLTDAVDINNFGLIVAIALMIDAEGRVHQDVVLLTPCDTCGAPFVPLAPTLPLFATGLGVLGLLGWRRKRKTQAAA